MFSEQKGIHTRYREWGGGRLEKISFKSGVMN
jgi:hypothetical protein